MRGRYCNKEELNALGKALSLVKGTVPIIILLYLQGEQTLFLLLVPHQDNVERSDKGYVLGRANPYVVIFPIPKMNESDFIIKNKLHFTYSL